MNEKKYYIINKINSLKGIEPLFSGTEFDNKIELKREINIYKKAGIKCWIIEQDKLKKIKKVSLDFLNENDQINEIFENIE